MYRTNDAVGSEWHVLNAAIGLVATTCINISSSKLHAISQVLDADFACAHWTSSMHTFLEGKPDVI